MPWATTQQTTPRRSVRLCERCKVTYEWICSLARSNLCLPQSTVAIGTACHMRCVLSRERSIHTVIEWGWAGWFFCRSIARLSLVVVDANLWRKPVALE